MVWTVSGGVKKNIKTKFLNFSTALTLVTYTLSGAAPVFLSQKVFAASPSDGYVATTGTDSGDCSNPATPCLTITYALSQADNGTVIHVAAGNYAGNDINISKSVTLSGAPGAVITVPDGSGINGFDVHANDVTIEGFDIEGPANSSYQTYAWGSNVTRGIFIYNGVTGFSIKNNTIQNLRNDILIDGRNTGSVTNNTIDNSKSGISVQYTDAGTGNTEGYSIGITGNTEGAYGNEWALNMHLNGHYDSGLGTLVGNATKIATNAPDSVQTALLANSTANGGWSVQDQGYSYQNRTEVNVATTGSDSSQGSKLGPLATVQAGVNAVTKNGVVTVNSGTYSDNVVVPSNGITLQAPGGATINLGSGYGINLNNGPAITGFTMTGFTVNSSSGTTYAFKAYKSDGLTLTNDTFNGGGYGGGVDINSTSDVALNNVSAGNFHKNGFAFTAKFFAGDTPSSNIALNNVTASGNGWAGIAFYNMNGSGTVGANITGVTFSGSNTVSGNGQGLFVEGDSDTNHINHTTPQYQISGSGGAPVDIGSTGFSSNAQDIDNYQTNDLDAYNATFNGQTGSQMSYAQRTSLKTSGDIIDSATYPTFGTVNIFDATGYINDPSQSNFTTPKYVRSHNSGDTAAQALVPKDAEDVRFSYNQTDGVNVYTNVSGTQHIQTGQFPLPSTGQQQWRGGVSAEAGKYTVTGEYKVGSTWYPITGSATAYVLGNPTGSFVIPTASNMYFRPSDNPLRIKADDKYNAFRNVIFNVSGTNYTVNRADCDLREAGNYVICDINKASNWAGLSEGTYSGTATLYNQASNHTAIASDNFIIDGTRPVVTNYKISPVKTAYGSTLKVSAKATDNGSGIKNVEFYVTAPRASDGKCDGNGTKLADSVATSPVSGDNYKTSVDVSGLDGTYCVNVIAGDNAANHSNPVQSIAFIADNTAPTVDITNPVDGQIYNGTAHILADLADNGSGLDSNRVVIQSKNSGSGWTTVYDSGWNSSTASNFDYAWNTKNGLFPDGQYRVEVYAQDVAGNKSHSTVKVTVDNTAPDVNITSPASGTLSFAKDGTVGIHGMVTDLHPGHYYLHISGPSGYSSGPGTVSDSSSFTDSLLYNWNLSGLASGTYTIDLEARDVVGGTISSGNKDSGSIKTITVTIDNTAPDTPAADKTTGTYTSTQLVSLSSNDALSNPVDIYYTTDGSTPNNVGNGTLYTGAISITSTATIKAVAYDGADNESAGVMSETYTITSPAPSVVTFSNNSGNSSNSSVSPQTTTTTSQNGTGAGAGGGNGGGNGGNGQVLGASTNTPNTNSDANKSGSGGSDDSSVLGSSTKKDTVASNSNFLGLGWWWLLVLVILLGLVYATMRGGGNGDNDKS